jgi:hypothetical protein
MLQANKALPVSVPDVLCLISVKAQVFYSVITGIAVNMMDNLDRRKVSTDMLFYGDAMFKCILYPILFFAWVGVVVWNHNANVSIGAVTFTVLPARSLLAALAIHSICASAVALAVHWVFFAGDVTVKSGVLVSKVSGCAHTAFRAISAFRSTCELPELFSALGAFYKLPPFFSFSYALHRAIKRLDGREGLIGLTTLFAGSSNHNLIILRCGGLCNR